jgi:hypothetical protein
MSYLRDGELLLTQCHDMHRAGNLVGALAAHPLGQCTEAEAQAMTYAEQISLWEHYESTRLDEAEAEQADLDYRRQRAWDKAGGD